MQKLLAKIEIIDTYHAAREALGQSLFGINEAEDYAEILQVIALINATAEARQQLVDAGKRREARKKLREAGLHIGVAHAACVQYIQHYVHRAS